MKKFFKNNLKMFFLVITIVLISCNKNKDNSCDYNNNKDNFSSKECLEKLSPKEKKDFLEELGPSYHEEFSNATDVVFAWAMTIEETSELYPGLSLEKPKKFIQNSNKDAINFFDTYDVLMEKEPCLISASDLVAFDSLSRSLRVNMDSVVFYMESLHLPIEKQLPN